MNPVHSVFINESILMFVPVMQPQTWKHLALHGISFDENKISVSDSIAEVERTQRPATFLYTCANPEVVWKIFLKEFLLVEAAGGLVTDESGRFLFIRRKGKWDLPKGKIEYDETIEQAAVREVAEETGLVNPEIVCPLEKTFHTYCQDGKRILKKNHWFLMAAKEPDKTSPQTEEDITEVKWFSKENIAQEVLPGLYASLRHLVRKQLH